MCITARRGPRPPGSVHICLVEISPSARWPAPVLAAGALPHGGHTMAAFSERCTPTNDKVHVIEPLSI